MSEKRDFGKLKDGRNTTLYIIGNSKGMKLAVTDYGASLVSLLVPDREENPVDVVLGYDNAGGYEKGSASFGATVGRNANRIGEASFEINGVHYSLEKNENGNNLHSGTDYYNKRMWQAEKEEKNTITFLLHSPDKDQGYPGSLDMRVTYELTEDNTVRIKYQAIPDKDTIINMTNHSYFNLDGHRSGNILDHQIMIDADYFTKTDAQSIPTGEVAAVSGTPMDFRTFKRIGAGIDADYEAIRLGNGYDHNWVLKNDGKFAKAAEAAGDVSGIAMEVWTDLPGVQVYTGNFLNQEPGKDGAVYGRRSAVCFETQYFPDSIHHENFRSPICRAGENYETITEYRFAIKKEQVI
ncbi:aldose epimerase family protein [Clostridium sp. C105KSO13]|uniref:aldose epimerase family protein n=1 Tax=Clostridium sp. C105KSO13 TaxID=1776045 RepID=UPI00074062D4|nr:aldose epimerase family protein [Clostridium sp. C105KSO13]CUX41604.1 Aldose 1-epimerase precursor [Clostridium sp. C105KSO13]